MDVIKMADAVFENVRSYVGRVISPLTDRLGALETTIKELPQPVALTPADVAPVLMPDLLEEVRRAVAAIPAPKDGESITAEDIHPVLMLELSKWALDFERRAQDVLQRAVDRMPLAKNGRDALDIDDFEVDTKDFGRTLVFRLKRGDAVIEREVTTGVVLDRGVYLPDTEYLKGDAVSWGGSVWIAQCGTKARPETDGSWRLSVKRGREGKPGSNVPAALPTTVKLP